MLLFNIHEIEISLKSSFLMFTELLMLNILLHANYVASHTYTPMTKFKKKKKQMHKRWEKQKHVNWDRFKNTYFTIYRVTQINRDKKNKLVLKPIWIHKLVLYDMKNFTCKKTCFYSRWNTFFVSAVCQRGFGNYWGEIIF